jgi:hypothetical protein
MNFFDQISATVRAMGMGIPAPLEVDGHVIATPTGWQYPQPVYDVSEPSVSPWQASYMTGAFVLSPDARLLLFLGVFLLALVIITRK